MTEFSQGQKRLIDRGVRVEFTPYRVVKFAGVPLIFSDETAILSLHQFGLGSDELKQLVKDVNVDDLHNYSEAMVVKKKNQPMVALCVGVDNNEAKHSPIAAIFNLTDEGSSQVMVTAGIRSHELQNSHGDAEGLDISRLLRGNSEKEVIEIEPNSNGLSVDIICGISGL